MRVSTTPQAVLVWLSSEETQQEDALMKANALAKHYIADPKQKIVTMRSGRADFVDSCELLLRNNL